MWKDPGTSQLDMLSGILCMTRGGGGGGGGGGEREGATWNNYYFEQARRNISRPGRRLK